MTKPYDLFKALFDLAVAVFLLIVFAIPMLIVALLVAINLGRPVLFRQVRPGRRGEPFTILKFRTMRDAVDASGNPLPDEKRLPKFGRILRATSLDELPELFNVIRGEMSLVGPRPLLVSYLTRYTAEQARRHEVLPGITGWAQVNGRNAISWEKKFELDVWYVDHRSFLLDLKTLLLTVKKVIRREGITAANHATTGEFLGSGEGAHPSI
jgi:sugar transferase EpsL